MLGVTITTNSVLVRLSLRLLNKLPNRGICERPGILERFSVKRSSSNPAITKLCPSASSTYVSIRRVASAGIVKPDKLTPFAGSSADTSGLTCILIVWFSVISGLNDRRMPNSRNITETALEPPPPCTIGTGNSPPTRKLASLPSVVTRLGSASICSKPWLRNAWMNAARFKSGRKAKMFSASLKVNLVPSGPPA